MLTLPPTDDTTVFKRFLVYIVFIEVKLKTETRRRRTRKRRRRRKRFDYISNNRIGPTWYEWQAFIGWYDYKKVKTMQIIFKEFKSLNSPVAATQLLFFLTS